MFNEIGIIHVVFLAALVITLYRVRKTLSGSGLRARHERHLSPRASARWHRVLLLEFIELTLAGGFLFLGGAELIGRPPMRSEERRVGEEGRSRWAPHHLKKKTGNEQYSV